jgi:hypothetical protein
VLGDPIIDAPLIGLIEMAIGPRRNKRSILHAEIRAAGPNRRSRVTDRRTNLREIRQGNLSLAFKNLAEKVRAAGRDGVPSFDVTRIMQG